MIPLTTTLRINGISSLATGLLLAIFPGVAANIFGVTATAPFVAVGLFLVVFASGVLFVAQRPTPAAVKWIIRLDTIWVIGSAVAIIFLFSLISGIGTVLIAGAALWVAAMAVLQQKGMRSFATA
ncbi:hypothetical protein [Chitinophaga caseinilytica]|uniref:SPW repeat-containing protein n=1 Tax=Chitinophaga caseinilytica TaxID=2267521 RepID=A0ABZ2Z8Y2_9BACT